MAVAEDTAAAVPAAPAPPIPKAPTKEGGPGLVSVSGAFRFLVFVALAAFLFYYVGPRDIAETALKVALAVALSAALWVGANLLFDLAYTRWALFNTLLGVIVGFGGFWVLEANDLLRSLYDKRVKVAGQGVFDDVTGWRTQPLGVNGLLWALIGGAALGLVMFLLSAPRQQLARLPLAVIGFTAFGLLTGYAFDESAWPAFDWVTVWICVAVGAGLFGLVGLWRQGVAAAPLSVLSGTAVGWAIGAWGGGDIGRGNRTGVLLATVVPAAIFGVRFGLARPPDATKRRRIEQRSRPWIFLTPALAFVVIGLLVPLLRTIYLSFRSRNGAQSVGWDNYGDIFTNKNTLNLSNWSAMFTSRLFWIGIIVLGLGFLAGMLAGRRTAQVFERGPASVGPIVIGLFVVSCAVLSVLRGTIMNNIWWVVVVVALATAIGLGVAVLADRSKGENGAKSLIFLPMAISFIGAGIIWRFVYQARESSQEQTGVLNAIWVWVGEVSTSTTSRTIAVVVLVLIALGFALLIKRGVETGSNPLVGFSIGFLLLLAYLIYRLLGPGLGGYIEADGVARPDAVLFIQETPFNNMWMMVVLIWIQTGFAMVILSAAIKAVPTDLIEAARIDGATESQVFWRITLPQIAPTLGVVVTTLIVTVMKVFDIVYAMTNGNFGTQVIANEMFQRAFGQSNFGLGSALAVVLFISVLPVMWINIRRMQKERAE